MRFPFPSSHSNRCSHLIYLAAIRFFECSGDGTENYTTYQVQTEGVLT